MSVESKPVLRFYFDPVCPWAWRTSLWIREVAKVRALQVEWDFLSLQAVNAGKDSLKDTHFKSEGTFRTMALLRREYNPAQANELIDKLYIEIGQAYHDRHEDLSQAQVVKGAIERVGLDPALYDRAMQDPLTLEEVERSHRQAIELGSFGVPSLLLTGNAKTTFGPVISQVPTGEEAGEMWDRIEWLIGRPEFFELKRSR